MAKDRPRFFICGGICRPRHLHPAPSWSILLEPTSPQQRAEGEGRWCIEISGLLPVEQATYKKAVLGGALAVP